jgi:transposase InsO family protein
MAGGKPFHRSYSCVKSVLQLRGLTTKAPRRGVHRRKRERRPLPGMMLFQDGSKHAWLERGPDLDLIVTMDDATSAITSIFLCEEEGTASSFRGLSETIRGHGLFSSFYTDRGSHYFTTPTAGAKVDKTQPTQVGRALKQLHIDHIPSYSPQARGRIERLWDTLQKRLPPLLRTNAITTMEAANHWLAEVYLEQHNARFAVAAAEEGTAFIPFVGELDNILCIEQERVAGLDNTVRYDGRCLQIPPNRNRHHFAKSTIRVLEYWNGAIALFHGPREIARFHSDGTPNQGAKAKKEFVA